MLYLFGYLFESFQRNSSKCSKTPFTYRMVYGKSFRFDLTEEKKSSFILQKFKASRDLTSTIIRSPDTFGACFENKCKTKVHNQYYGMGCCCNTHLCNKSFPITKSSISLLGVALLASINMILSY